MTLERIGKAQPYRESEKARKAWNSALGRLVDRIIIEAWVEYDKAHNWPKIEGGSK